MTMRYMKHAPEAYLDADAAAIVEQMSGAAGAKPARVSLEAETALRRA